MKGFGAEIVCPAKINLHLEVGETYREGLRSFHRICTLLQGVYLKGANDLLELSLSPESVPTASEVHILLEVQPQDPYPRQENLVYRAAQDYLAKAAEVFSGKCPNHFNVFWPEQVRFVLRKYIPQQAGLGGGSSNAAAALKLLNQCLANYWGNPALGREAMQELAAALGSDVPFFLRDFSSFASSLGWGLGRGEQIIAVSPEFAAALQRLQSRCQLWLLKPRGISCHTGEMYEFLDQHPRQLQRNPLDIEQQLLADSHRVRHIFSNDFYQAIEFYSGSDCGMSQTENAGLQVLATLPQYLYSLAASWVALSGSGSAFFAWFPREQSPAKILDGLAAFPQPLDSFAAKPYSKSIDIWTSASG